MIQERTSQACLQEFLCCKYSWTIKTFSAIDWQAHSEALATFPLLPKVTVMKLLHGWLATQKKSFQAGSLATAQCILCGEVEDRTHIYSCQFEALKRAREKDWRQLDRKISSCTHPTVGKAIIACLHSVTSITAASIYREEFVNDRMLALALEEQEEIGWDHFLLGRMSNRWKSIGPSEEYLGNSDGWARKIAKEVIDFGIQLWKRRNLLLHGNRDGGPSKLEHAKTEALIITLYEELLPNIHPSHGWLFSTPCEVRLLEPHTVQIAWIDSVRRIYPVKYKEMRTQLGQIDFRQDQVEYIKLAATGGFA